MKELRQKREIPQIINKLLATDVYMTDQFVKYVEKVLVFKQLKIHYKMLEISCHGLLWFPGWIAFIWLLNSSNLYQLQVNLLLGLLLDITCIALLKAITRRRRPAKNERYEIGPDKFSFPSGHASRASLITCFLLYNWPVHFIFIPPLLCWTITVSISRVLMRRHHLLDIFVGIFLGIIESFLIGLIFLEKDTCKELIYWFTDEKLDGGEYHV